jgi:lysophospholipase L1-like esterase
MSYITHKTLALLLCGVISVGGLQSIDAEPFQDGDKVCFLGDSITHNGYFHSYIYLYYQTRFPNRHVEFINCGVSGGRTSGALSRLDEDVLVHNPNVIVINLGMNDVGTSHYIKFSGEKKKASVALLLEKYRNNMTELVDRILAHDPKPEIILLSPSPYDQTGTQERESAVGKNDSLIEVTKFLKKLAAEKGVKFIDQHSPMHAMNMAGQAKDPDFTIISADRVHPGPMGHMIMAHLFLTGQDVGDLVSHVNLSIHGSTAKVNAAKKAKVDVIKVEEGVVEFAVSAESLPYPVEDIVRKSNQPTARAALDFVPFQDQLNQEILEVKGLAAPRYQLDIDGTPVGIYTSAELAIGINLAGNELTPQYQQAETVARLNHERWDMERPLRALPYVRTKVMREGGVDPDDANAVTAYLESWREGTAHRDHNSTYDRQFAEFKHPVVRQERWDKLAEKTKQIYAASQPIKHTYVLTPTELKELPKPGAAAAGVNEGLENYGDLLEFDELTVWEGLEHDADNPKSGNASGIWGDTVAVTRVRCRSFPSDVSSFDTMRVWVHSEKATGAKFAMIFRQENDATDGPDYQMTITQVDWTGWKQIEVPFSSLDTIREPNGMADVTEFLMASQGYKCGEPIPGTRLKFDKMEFLQAK